MNKFKANLQEKLNKIIEIKADTVADLLVYIAFFIIFGTTFILNKYVAMYILSVFLLITSYFIGRGGKE